MNCAEYGDTNKCRVLLVHISMYTKAAYEVTGLV